MKSIYHWIRKQLDKWPSSPGLICSGHWYVRYNDGQRSTNMTYDVCKSYANIFGGEVVYNRQNNRTN